MIDRIKLFFKKKKRVSGDPISMDAEQLKETIEDLREYIKICEESSKYSNQRFDYLVIVLSSTGILFLANLLSYFNEKEVPINLNLFSGAIGLFVFTILINFISQYLSMKSHAEEARLSKKKISDIRQSSVYDERLYSTLQNQLDGLDGWVRLINIGTIFTLSLGAVFGIVFYLVGVAQ